MQPFGRNGYGPKIGGCAPLAEGNLVPIQHNVARAESYLHAKFHFDPSNRLATIDNKIEEGLRSIFGEGSGVPI